MKYTKEMWSRLTPEERSWLVYYHKHCNNWGSMGGYLPDDSSECVVCDQPQMGSGVCMVCLKEADRLYKIMEDSKMPVKEKENNYTCGTCKHYNHKEDCCWLARDMFFAEDEHCCIYWEEEVELTDEEKRDIIGDRKAHRIMVEEGHIE